jgi:hypothetical protein
MRPVWWMVFALAAARFCPGVEICLEDRAKLSLPAIAAMQTELSLIVPDARIKSVSDTCDFHLTIRADSMPGRPDVLGRTPVSGGHILPRAEVFAPSVIHLLGDLRSHTLLGRAIARVAAHEIGHHLSQQGDHQESGLMRSQLTAAQLVGADRVPLMLRVRRSSSD